MYLIYLNYRDYVCSNVYTEKKNQSRSRKVNEYNSSCVQKQCVCYTIIFFYNFDISTNACVNLPELWAMIIFACWITELLLFFFFFAHLMSISIQLYEWLFVNLNIVT